MTTLRSKLRLSMAAFSDFNVWTSSTGFEEALVLSQKPQKRLRFLSSFHMIITFDPFTSDRLSLYLTAFNGRVLKTETVDSKGNRGIKSSEILRDLKGLKLCMGIKSEAENPRFMREYLGDSIVTRTEDCQYISSPNNAFEICDNCYKFSDESRLKSEIQDNIKVEAEQEETKEDISIFPDFEDPLFDIESDDEDEPISKKRRRNNGAVKAEVDSDGEEDPDFDFHKPKKKKKRTPKKAAKLKVEDLDGVEPVADPQDLDFDPKDVDFDPNEGLDEETSVSKKRAKSKKESKSAYKKIDVTNFTIPKEFLEPSQKSRFVCSICWASREQIQMFSAHLKTHAEKLPGLNEVAECDRCQKKIANKWQTIPHLMKEHGSVGRICFICRGDIFEDSASIQHHLKLHHSELSEDQLTDNMKNLWVRSYNKFMCNICGCSSQNMTKHMNIVHPDTSGPKIICTICGWEAYNRHQMEKHVYRQHPSKIYVCNVCNLAFGTTSKFRKHYRSHQAEKPFKCGRCDYRSNRNTNVFLHIRKMHKEIVESDVKATCVQVCKIPDKLTDEDIAKLCTIKMNETAHNPYNRGKNKDNSNWGNAHKNSAAKSTE